MAARKKNKHNRLAIPSKITVTVEVDRYGNPYSSEMDLIDYQDFSFSDIDEAIDFVLTCTASITTINQLKQFKQQTIKQSIKQLN